MDVIGSLGLLGARKEGECDGRERYSVHSNNFNGLKREEEAALINKTCRTRLDRLLAAERMKQLITVKESWSYVVSLNASRALSQCGRLRRFTIMKTHKIILKYSSTTQQPFPCLHKKMPSATVDYAPTLDTFLISLKDASLESSIERLIS